MVDPDSGRVSRAPPYSGTARETSPFRVRGFHPLCQAFPMPFRYAVAFLLPPLGAAALQPRRRRRFGLLRFRSPLLSESLLISVPGVLRWFSSPSIASVNYLFVHGWRARARRVTPFGRRRISGCLLLPAAFRSLPRPSSPRYAKASTPNPSLA